MVVSDEAWLRAQRVNERGFLVTSKGNYTTGNPSLQLPDPRVTIRTMAAPNLSAAGTYAARIVDNRGALPVGLVVDLLWPADSWAGMYCYGASLLTCGDAPCGIEVEIDGELGEMDHAATDGAP